MRAAGLLLQLGGAAIAVAGFWATGRIARRRLLRAVLPTGDDAFLVGCDFGLGAWIVWTGVFALGLAGGLRRAPALALFALTAIAALTQLPAAWPHLRRALAATVDPRGRFDRGVMLLLATALTLAAVGALSPPAAQDALVHHLAVPKAYITGGMRELPYNYFSYFPLGAELLFLYGLLVAGEGMATLIHFAFGVAIALTMAAAQDTLHLTDRGRTIAVALFLLTPTVWMEMTWAYVDLALTFYVLVALLAVLRYRDDPRRAWLGTTGFALGGALSIKYTALAFVGLVTLVAWAVLRERGVLTARRALACAALIASVALAVSAPWFVRNAIYTGNPLFPFLLDWIPSHNEGWDAERGRIVLEVLRRYGGRDKSILDYLLVIVKLPFLARLDVAARWDGSIGPMYGGVFVAVAMWRCLDRAVRYLLAAAGAFYVFWLFASQHLRYLLPALPLVALAIGAAGDAIVTRWPAARRGMAAVVGAGLLVQALMIGSYFRQFGYGPVVFGRVTSDEYLRARFDYYRFYEYINARTPARSRIFLVLASNQPYYLDREAFSDSVFEDITLARIVRDARSPDDIARALRGRGLTHLLFRPYALFAAETTPFSGDEGPRFVAFLQRCRLLLGDDHFALFELPAGGEES